MFIGPPLGLTPPAKKFFPLSLCRSTGAMQPYAHFCVCSSSLLAQSRWNANSCILGSRAPLRGGAEVDFGVVLLTVWVGLGAKTCENSAVLTASRVEYSKGPSSHDVMLLY